MSFPYLTGDIPTNEEFNEVFGALQGKTSGNPLVDPKLILKNLDLSYGVSNTVASSATITLDEKFLQNITGTVDIATINVIGEGTFKLLKFSGNLKLLTSGNIITIGNESLQVYSNSTVLIYQFNSTDWIVVAANNELINSSGSVASAATITLGKNYFYDISGTTNIATINPIHIGKKIRLKFQDNLTLLNTGNIKNAGNLDFEVYNGVIVDLYQYDLNNWIITSSNKLLSKVQFDVQLTSVQSVPENVQTKIEFDNIIIDTHSAFDTGNYRFIAPVSGIYCIDASLRISAASNGKEYNCIIMKNGANYISDNEILGATYDLTIGVDSNIIPLLKNDYVEVALFHDSVGSRNIAVSGIVTKFTGILLN